MDMDNTVKTIQQHMNEMAGLVDALRVEVLESAAKAETLAPLTQRVDALTDKLQEKQQELAQAEAKLREAHDQASLLRSTLFGT